MRRNKGEREEAIEGGRRGQEEGFVFCGVGLFCVYRWAEQNILLMAINMEANFKH